MSVHPRQHFDLANTDAISLFDSAIPVAEKLKRARTELLDRSARNRLLNIPRSTRAARSLEVIDDHSGRYSGCSFIEEESNPVATGKPQLASAKPRFELLPEGKDLP